MSYHTERTRFYWKNEMQKMLKRWW